MVCMNFCWICGGRGEAPEMQILMDVRSYLPSWGFASNAEYMVGTPQKIVTLCFWMFSGALVESNLGIRTIFAARLMGTFMLVVMP